VVSSIFGWRGTKPFLKIAREVTVVIEANGVSDCFDLLKALRIGEHFAGFFEPQRVEIGHGRCLEFVAEDPLKIGCGHSKECRHLLDGPRVTQGLGKFGYDVGDSRVLHTSRVESGQNQLSSIVTPPPKFVKRPKK